MGWWVAVPLGIALGLALALAIDSAAAPASAQAGRSGVTLSAEQLRINQKISQAAVKRANRANSRLDRLPTAATAGAGPGGPPGPAGPAGPAGPTAARAAFSAAMGDPAQMILDVAGLTISAACQAEASGGTELAVTFGLAQATTFVGTVNRIGGADPDNPTLRELENIEAPLPAGTNPIGGPVAPDGEFIREVASVLFIMPTRTLSLDVVLFADGTADRCSFNAVAVPA
jgi:hypothetical protein